MRQANPIPKGPQAPTDSRQLDLLPEVVVKTAKSTLRLPPKEVRHAPVAK